MMDLKHMRPTKLLWVDLEMTGLDPERHVILEVAAKITDFDLRPIAEYGTLIFQPDEALAQANEWTKAKDAVPGGLFELVRTAGRPEKEVEAELAQLIDDNFGDEPAVLAGNSIHQDRRFIRKWWPDIEALLHYRMLDVSSFKVLMRGKYGLEFPKRETHRALDDIQESIDELQYYLNWLQQHNES